jgi:hypothetical protein
MPLLRVETYEIEGGVSEPRKIRVKFNDGREGTYDYPEGQSHDAAHDYAISRLMDRATFDRVESFYKVGDTATGHKYTIFLKEATP